jgi:hypothetical protein
MMRPRQNRQVRWDKKEIGVPVAVQCRTCKRRGYANPMLVGRVRSVEVCAECRQWVRSV